MKKRRYLLLLIGILSSCVNVESSSSTDNQVSTDETSDVENTTTSESSTIVVENEVETWNILEDSIYETTVYKFTSNIPGPKYAIVGGIHGDEVAGWKAALMLKERRDFIGEVLIIPQANILADKREERYPGKGKAVNGIVYKDLNRNFPGNPDGNVTKQIAYAITETVKSFEPDVIVDLHESLRSSSSSYFDSDTSSRLGDLLIYGNSWTSLFTQSVIDEYNTSYLQDGDYPFGTDTYAPGGSFNQYFGGLYEDKIVITIETTRYINSSTPKSEERRIQQQLELIDLILKYAVEY